MISSGSQHSRNANRNCATNSPAIRIRRTHAPRRSSCPSGSSCRRPPPAGSCVGRKTRSATRADHARPRESTSVLAHCQSASEARYRTAMPPAAQRAARHRARPRRGGPASACSSRGRCAARILAARSAPASACRRCSELRRGLGGERQHDPIGLRPARGRRGSSRRATAAGPTSTGDAGARASCRAARRRRRARRARRRRRPARRSPPRSTSAPTGPRPSGRAGGAAAQPACADRRARAGARRPARAPVAEPERHPRGPRILTADELEAVRAQLIARLQSS